MSIDIIQENAIIDNKHYALTGGLRSWTPMTTPTLSEVKIQYSFDAQTWFAKELLAQVMFIVVLAKLIKNIIECI